jgi:hypothetical protein
MPSLDTATADVVCNLADEVRKQLAGRLAEHFMKTGRNSGRVSKKEIVDRTIKDHSREKAAPKLIWLDCVKYEAADTGKHHVEFQVCSKLVGGERAGVCGYRATLVEHSDAPEGMAILELAGADP